MNEQNLNVELICLDSITILNAAIQNDPGLTTLEYLGYDIHFQYQLTPSVSMVSKKVRIVADYEIKASKKEGHSADISSRYKISFIYSIEKLAEFVVLDENNYVIIEEEILSNLLNITYSTSRGILYTRCLGTVMDGLILPVISTIDLFNNPTVIKVTPIKK